MVYDCLPKGLKKIVLGLINALILEKYIHHAL